MMVVKMEQGYDRVRAASFAWESTAFPMLTGTLVTAAGFLPIGFANSAVGEYAGGIFWVVAIALVASWFVAVIFTPYIGVKLLPNLNVQPHHDPHAIYETRIYRTAPHGAVVRRPSRQGRALDARRFRARCRRLWPGAAAVFPAFGAARTVLPAAPAGGHRDRRHRKSVKKAEALIKDDEDIATYTAYVGQGSPRFWLGLNPQLPNEAFAEIVIVSKDVEARERVKTRIEKAVADGALSEARVRVDRFNFGPPVGFPVQFRVVGPDPTKVRDIAYQVREVMRDQREGSASRLERAVPYVKLVVDQERARALGLTPQDVAQALRMLVSGVPVTTVRDGTEKVEVVARAVPAERLDLGRFGDLTVSRNGMAVPLAQVARSSTATRKRSSGGATATWPSPCGPTWSTVSRRRT